MAAVLLAIAAVAIAGASTLGFKPGSFVPQEFKFPFSYTPLPSATPSATPTPTDTPTPTETPTIVPSGGNP